MKLFMQFFPTFLVLRLAVARAISSLSLTAEARIVPQAIACGICSGRSVTGRWLLPSISVLHWHRHSINAPPSSIIFSVE